jgi:hypothetical protein
MRVLNVKEEVELVNGTTIQDAVSFDKLSSEVTIIELNIPKVYQPVTIENPKAIQYECLRNIFRTIR